MIKLGMVSVLLTLVIVTSLIGHTVAGDGCTMQDDPQPSAALCQICHHAVALVPPSTWLGVTTPPTPVSSVRPSVSSPEIPPPFLPPR